VPLTVAGAIASVKVAVIAELTGTPVVGPGVVVAGTVSVTPGRVVSAEAPVVNFHT
jgi:hypothetical protein